MPKVSQTGPGRITSSRRLPAIPNEIFLEIFGYIQASIEMEPAECTRILSQLCLVCSFFCAALRPRLFNRLELSGRDGRTNPPSTAFCRALVQGDPRARLLAAHVRTCKILYWGGTSTKSAPWAGMGFVLMYRQALRWVPNIEALTITFSQVDDAMWETVGRFSKLKSLRVTATFFSSDVPAYVADQIAALRLSTCAIQLQYPVPPFPRLLNPTALHEVSADIDTLNVLLSGGPINTLEILTILGPIPIQSLINILSKVPSIRSLTLSLYANGVLKATPQDFAALLPNLRSLTCSLPHMTLLAPGRPLTRLHIINREPAFLFNLNTILGSTEPNTTITELCVPLTTSDETSGTGRFPCLRKLELHVLQDFHLPSLLDPEAAAEFTSLIASSCEKWAGNPLVHQVHMHMRPLEEFPLGDLAQQHAMLTGHLSRTFPALLRFRLDEYALWERFAVDEAWRVLVAPEHRALLLMRWGAGDPGAVDYDGYLQRLSTI